VNKQDELKKLVGEEAAAYVKDGMKIGLGSGSTMYYTVKALGERVKEGLQIAGIPTSNITAEWAEEFGIPLTDFSEVTQLDLAIDGADEVDSDLHLIKGGGGALLREKIVADAAEKLLIIVDESKMVPQLGKFPLPIEIVPFGWEGTVEKVAQLGVSPVLRKKEGEVFVTDNGNYILDIPYEKIDDPVTLHDQLKSIVGVVETGLFVHMADEVLVGEDGKVKRVKK
jgi:ribose 5-phosphate isomerase A